MITSVSLSEIENTLIRQLNSFWELSARDRSLINNKMTGGGGNFKV